MIKRIHLLCALALTTFAAGCVTAPPATENAVSAYSVGDRACFTFNELVVSLPFRGANAPYQNLHLTPAALINVRGSAYSASYQPEGILRRLEPRLAARLSETLSGLGEQSLSDTSALRQRILQEAQAVIDEAMRHWERGSEYRVEMVLASLYWTDASAGRVQPQPRGWW